MNQNKEQDFLDSPEFVKKLFRFAEEYRDYEARIISQKEMDEETESLKTFIREKMKEPLPESLKRFRMSESERKAAESFLYFNDIPDHPQDFKREMIFAFIQGLRRKPQIVFPTEQEIEKQFQDVSDSKSQFGEIHEAERKGARWAIKFIKEKN